MGTYRSPNLSIGRFITTNESPVLDTLFLYEIKYLNYKKRYYLFKFVNWVNLKQQVLLKLVILIMHSLVFKFDRIVLRNCIGLITNLLCFFPRCSHSITERHFIFNNWRYSGICDRILHRQTSLAEYKEDYRGHGCLHCGPGIDVNTCFTCSHFTLHQLHWTFHRGGAYFPLRGFYNTNR